MVGGSALGAPCCALDWHLGSHGRFLDLGPYLPGLRASTTMCKWASRSVQNTFNVIRKLYHIGYCENFVQRTSGKILKIKTGKIYQDPPA